MGGGGPGAPAEFLPHFLFWWIMQFDVKTNCSEICWGSEYPAELPDCNLDSFYNKHLLAGVKTAVLAALQEEAEQYLGMGMTYTLFEWMREQLDTLLATQPETLQQISEDLADLKVADFNNVCLHLLGSYVDHYWSQVKESSPEDEGGGKGRGERKEQLTKAQKRAQWKKGGLNESDRERGWNWVDVVK